MKRLLMILLVMMLCISAVVAEDVQSTVLGLTADWYYIHQYTAPNGQDMYFTAMEDTVDIIFQDVNFDGKEDIVVYTILGAHNAFCEFFVYDVSIGQYVRAEHSGSDERLCNYQLYPEYGLVVTQTNYGCAGACHEYRLYRWEGTQLECIRTTLSEELTETTWDDESFTTTTYTDVLHMTVRDHTLGDWDGSVVWEKTIPMDADEYLSAHEEEMNALWQGLK